MSFTLKQHEQLFTPEDPNTLTVLNSFAVLLKAMGDLEESEAVHNRVLDAHSYSGDRASRYIGKHE